jgi:hypothetical protein
MIFGVLCLTYFVRRYSMADTTKEVAASGQTLADFIEELGKSVATGQGALDKNTAKIATELSKIMVNVPSIIEEVINDEGMPTKVNVIERLVPFSTLVLPVVYQFSRIFFQADLKISELDKNSSVKLVKSASALRGGAKISADITSLASGGLPGGSANFSGSLQSSNANTANSNSIDESIANLHFEATMEPRREIEVPQPIVVRKGPRITIAVTKYEMTGATPAQAAADGRAAVAFVPEKRVCTVKIQVFSANGKVNPVALQHLSISADANDLHIESKLEADSLEITVTRTQGSEKLPLPPMAPSALRVTLGTITEVLSLDM